jgi:glycerophosphoryl diester phosphodiesterase
MYSGKTLPLAISHRGLHSAFPENSIPAFRAAIEAGASGIELDVHASADGVLYVHHDASLDVAGRSAPIAELDSGAVSRLTLPGETAIPTLDDVLALTADKCDVFIEIKAPGIEEQVVRCLRRHIAHAERFALHAFDHRIVKRVLELSPGIRTGILQVSYLVDSCSAMRRAGALDLWQHADFIDALLVHDVHSCGGRVIAWTPNRDAEWARLTESGVDGICTDDVDAYVKWTEDRVG